MQKLKLRCEICFSDLMSAQITQAYEMLNSCLPYYHNEKSYRASCNVVNIFKYIFTFFINTEVHLTILWRRQWVGSLSWLSGLLLTFLYSRIEDNDGDGDDNYDDDENAEDDDDRNSNGSNNLNTCRIYSSACEISSPSVAIL